jgi:hypothetical protein
MAESPLNPLNLGDFEIFFPPELGVRGAGTTFVSSLIFPNIKFASDILQ